MKIYKIKKLTAVTVWLCRGGGLWPWDAISSVESKRSVVLRYNRPRDDTEHNSAATRQEWKYGMNLRSIHRGSWIFVATLLVVVARHIVAEHVVAAEPTNTNEADVPDFTLPDLLQFDDGNRVATAADWPKRRSEILRHFEKYVYGRTPTEPFPSVEYVQLEESTPALGGIREQIRITFANVLHADVMIYRPKQKAKGTFVGLNFMGNHTLQPDKEILLNDRWMRSVSKKGVVDHKATAESRGTSASRWPLKMIIDSGYAVATCYCGDFDPDKYVNSFDDGVHKLFYKEGQEKPADDEWGSIGGWAWGLSRILDYLETRSDLESNNVAVFGHSRLGKTSLWAGAQDTRFKIAISNNSGCGGAALYRRRFGERLDNMAERFPDWFCVNHGAFANRENELPIDQHMLIALLAPRAVYIASAQQDTWADPRGEFLAALNAHPVYQLLGQPGLLAASMPSVNTPATGTIGYHIRSGPHDVTDFDWQEYIKFADRHFAK